MPQHGMETFDTAQELEAHLDELHPDWEYLNEDRRTNPGVCHYNLHQGEWAHRAIATHLIEGHGYSIQTVRNNPSPQLVIEHMRLHNDEFADANESTWNHTHEPPRVWEPEIHAEDVVGRVVMVKTRAQDRDKWVYGTAIEELRQQGANLVLFMDRHDTLETLDVQQMRNAGWWDQKYVEELCEVVDALRQTLDWSVPRSDIDALATRAEEALRDRPKE